MDRALNIDIKSTLSNIWILLPMSVAVISVSLSFLFPKKRQLLPGGLVNLGNTCFANSVLQALSSCPTLIEYLRNSDTEMDLMVLDLAERLNELTTSPLNPKLLLNALSMTSGRKGLLGYQQQDAHEFLVSLTDRLSKDIVLDNLVDMFTDDRYQGVFLGSQINFAKSSLKSPIKGYLAMRLWCQTCGYKTPITHESFDNISLNVDKRHVTNLKYLLANSVATEIIDDWCCDKCTLIRTIKSIQDESRVVRREINILIKKMKKDKYNQQEEDTPLKEAIIPDSTDSVNKDRLNSWREKLAGLDMDLKSVQDILEKDLEMPLPSRIKKIKTGSPTLKRTLISRPPLIFTIHMQRSIFDYMGNVIKNNCRVDYSEYLDIKDFCTCSDGYYFNPMEMADASNWKESLDVRSDEVMASRSTSNDTTSAFKESFSPVAKENSNEEYIYLYKLNAVVLHYGSHDSGHFVTYRRFPRKLSNSKTKGEKWYAISDDHVRRIWDVQGEVFGYATQFVYLLFYERCQGLTENEALNLKTTDKLVTQFQNINNKKED